jgi:hypothetical protein
MSTGDANLERILTAPDAVALHAEVRAQMDAAGIDRPRLTTGIDRPAPPVTFDSLIAAKRQLDAIDGDPSAGRPDHAAVDAASAGAADHWRAIGRAASVCRCDPHRAVVAIQAQEDGSATVSCPKCLAQFTMPPLVAGGQGRDADEVRRHAWTVALLIALSAIVLAAAMIGGAL